MFSGNTTSLTEKRQTPTSSTVIGALLRKHVQGDWAVGTLKAAEGEIRVVGEPVAHLVEGVLYECTGQHRHHAKYGAQFVVASVLPSIPADRAAIARHLASSYSGVGPKTAELIVNWFVEHESLDALRTLLVKTPWRLEGHQSVSGHRGIRLLATEDGPHDALANDLLTRFGALGIPAPVLRRVARWLVGEGTGAQLDVAAVIDGALEVFFADPYRAVLYVSGYSFPHAESIAGRLGISPQATCRVVAVVLHTITTATSSEGHTYIPLEQLKTALRVHGIQASAQDALQAAIAADGLIAVERNRIYPVAALRVERKTAEMLATMLADDDPLVGSEHSSSLQAKISFAATQNEPPLDAHQQAVIRGMLTSSKRLHTLTAGPGCGKTAIMQVMAKLAPGVVRFCAPTGKAAKVLAARVGPYGFRAGTVHSLLEMTPEGFARNEDNRIDADVIVLDEAGMNDALILYSLLRAMKDDAHLFLLGDTHQLPSVGSGNTLADILALPADHHRLHKTYRNSGDILQLVASVRQGRFELPAHPDGSVIQRHLPSAIAQGLCAVETEYLSSIDKVGIANVILILARRTGSLTEPNWSTNYFNRRLQQLINPDGDRLPGTILRVGDRVLIRRNLSLQVDGQPGNNPVVNGDTGRIVSFETDGTALYTCKLLLDDARSVTFPVEHIEHIDLAYAMTVHAAQGSEYEHVIYVATDGSPRFIHRRLFFTAISRPRDQLTVYGDTSLLRRIVARPGPDRYTHLVQTTLALIPTCSNPSP